MPASKGGGAKPGQRSIMSFFAKKPAAQAPAAAPKPKPKPVAEAEAAPAGSPPKRKAAAASPARAPAVAGKGGDGAGPAAKKMKGSPVEMLTTATGGRRARPAAPAGAEQARPGAAAGAGAPAPPERGARVRVWWGGDAAWYHGVVADVDVAEGKYLVEYDDGEELWHELAADKYETLPAGAGRDASPPAPAGARRGRAAAKRGARRVVLDSDDEFDSGDSESDAEVSDDESDWDANVDGASDDDDVSMDEEDDSESDDDPSESDAPSPPPKKKGKAPAKKAAASRARPPAVSAVSRTPAPAMPAPGRLSGGFSPLGGAGSPSAGAGASSFTSDAALGGDAVRFAGRYDSPEFSFLRNPRDANRVAKGEPGYDPTTIYVPPSFLEKQTPSMRQWWEFKSKCFDAVMLFKMGKFYELFEMDAHLGHSEVGLLYMGKDEKPHTGFPEKNYARIAEALARKGHRVLVIEQVETPAMLEARNKLKKKGQPKEKVVRREKCALLSAGTIVDPEMLQATPDAAYLLVLSEGEPSTSPDGGDELVFGACAVDAASAVVRCTQWRDDASASGLRALLAELRPAEVLRARAGAAGALGEAAMRAIRACCRPMPKIGELEPSSQLWGAERTIRELKDGGCVKDMPAVVQALADAGADGELGLSTLGGAIWYLRQALLDKEVLSAAHFGPLDVNAEGCAVRADELARAAPSAPTADASVDAAAEEVIAPHMEMDGAALANLEVLANTRDGGVSGTLLALVDRCTTAPGRRLLRRWLCRPLACPASIKRRQDAVAALKQGGALADAALAAREELRRIPDLERAVGRLASQASGQGRTGSSVVLYEDAARSKLNALLGALRGFRALGMLPAAFARAAEASEAARTAAAQLPLRQLNAVGPLIAELEDAFDWDEAEQAGRIVPAPGADSEYDGACEEAEAIEQQLDEELGSLRGMLGATAAEVKWISQQKETHQLEVPDRLVKKVPADWEISSQRKGFRRYLTPEVKTLRTELQRAHERKEAALTGALTRVCERAAAGIPVLRPAADAAARLDALLSLAAASELMSLSGASCRPVVRAEDADEGPVLRATRARHPGAADNFVPNDIALGGSDAERALLLTGPNMGGKSTLMRTACLAAVLAQVGCDVPAEACELTPADRVFVRMGANDSLVGGESTFMVELSEASAVLRRATKSSLVALDELGRGTSTADGAAIAGAVLQYLAERSSCRTLFSTHYHMLSTSNEGASGVALGHMSAAIETDENGDEQVTFLYTLAPGACPKSYGVNVARLAGLPESVLAVAKQASRRFEAARGRTGKGAAIAAARNASRVVRTEGGADATAIRAAWADARASMLAAQ